jgi:hypothetical protein
LIADKATVVFSADCSAAVGRSLIEEPDYRPGDAGAGLLWTVSGGRVVEIHRDWASIELAQNGSQRVLTGAVSPKGSGWGKSGSSPQGASFFWGALAGARTILLLADNDVQLTSHALVAEAFVPIARARDDAPDETYMITTYGDKTWYAWPILIDNVSYFDLSARYHPIHLEFDASTLRPAMDR